MALFGTETLTTHTPSHKEQCYRDHSANGDFLNAFLQIRSQAVHDARIVLCMLHVGLSRRRTVGGTLESDVGMDI